MAFSLGFSKTMVSTFAVFFYMDPMNVFGAQLSTLLINHCYQVYKWTHNRDVGSVRIRVGLKHSTNIDKNVVKVVTVRYL
jgi:hypothetical protein